MPGLSENAISFFGAGGHKHDGASSTLISTVSYSLFDFKPGYIGSQSRIETQVANQTALEDWVLSIVNTKVLAPAGLNLAPGLLSGKTIRANTITAIQLQANTITADEIAANAVTANELAANLVLVNNVIRSNNYNGTIAANGAITATGNAGWAITSFGSAEFSSASIRGVIDADSVTTPGLVISNTGAITSANFNVTANGHMTANSAFFEGYIDANAGLIGNILINDGSIQSSDYDANNGFQINSNGSAFFNEVSVKGNLQFANSVTPGTFSDGGSLTDGLIGGIFINANEIQSNGFTSGSVGFRIGANGSAEFNDVTVRGTMDASTIIGSSVTVGTFDGTSTGLQITSDGFIKGSGGGVKIKNWGTGTGTALFGDSIQTPTVIADKVSVSNGTNEFETDVNNVSYLTDITFTSTTADYAAVRILRSGTTAGSYHMSFGKTDGTNVGGIRYRANTNNTMAFIGDITGSSDIRLKENVQPLTNSLLIINQINPVKFNFISSPDSLEDGFIAQELFEIYPLAVEQGGDDPLTNPWSVMQPRLIPILTGAIKELSSKVDSLETRIQTLEGV